MSSPWRPGPLFFLLFPPPSDPCRSWSRRLVDYFFHAPRFVCFWSCNIGDSFFRCLRVALGTWSLCRLVPSFFGCTGGFFAVLFRHTRVTLVFSAFPSPLELQSGGLCQQGAPRFFFVSDVFCSLFFLRPVEPFASRLIVFSFSFLLLF